MNRRLPVSSLLLGTLGASLALTFACGGGGKGDNTGGTSGTSSAGQPASGGSTGGTVMGSGGNAMGGSMGGSASPTGGTGGGAAPAGGSAGVGVMTGGSAGNGVATGGAGAVGATGGSAGTPAMGGTGPAGGSGGGMETTCTITDTPTQAENIQTVFNVGVTTDLAGFDGGYVEFGVDTTYGYQAPLDMTAKSAMLLGMKQATDYHYRVVVTAGGMKCTGMDKTLTTGGLLTGFPKATITTQATDKSKLTGGFMVAEFYGGSRKVPFILDKDLDVVWAYDPKFNDGGQSCCDTTRARMSIDGKWMWVAHGNVPSVKGLMKKIAMDGSMEVDKSDKFVGMNHDFTILDDEHQTMYFVAYSSGTCDDVVEYDPVTDMNRTVVNLSKAFTSGACHANAIEYSPEDDTLFVSELDHQAYVKIDRKTGDIKWTLGGGTDNDFTGDGSTWTKEHNMHVLAKDHFVFFNNGPGMGQGSVAIELQLDETAKTATKKWSYTANPIIANAIMGDVQRMPNGNTIVAFSTQGVVHEVDAMGTLLQSISWGAGGAIGYIIKRPTLYGKPPR